MYVSDIWYRALSSEVVECFGRAWMVIIGCSPRLTLLLPNQAVCFSHQIVWLVLQNHNDVQRNCQDAIYKLQVETRRACCFLSDFSVDSSLYDTADLGPRPVLPNLLIGKPHPMLQGRPSSCIGALRIQ